jgi:hypothetical protein
MSLGYVVIAVIAAHLNFTLNAYIQELNLIAATI